MPEHLDSPLFEFVTIDITPSQPVPLAGYSARSGVFRRIDGKLEANVLLIASGPAFVVLVTLDTLFIEAEFHAALAQAIGISPACLLLVASHTHNAPALARSTPSLGAVDEAYYESCIERISGAIKAKLGSQFMELKLAATAVYGGYAVNRRRPSWVLTYSDLKRGRLPKFGKRVAQARNPNGFADNMLKAWAFFSTKGIEAIIWSIAAHPAFYPRIDSVSPDFPGAVRLQVRRQYGSDLPVLFLPGFAGSAIPNFAPALPLTFKQVVAKSLPFHQLLPYQTMKGFCDYCEGVSSSVMAALELMPSPTICSMMAFENMRSPAVFFDNSGAQISLNMSALNFSGNLSIVISSGELLGEWVPILNLPSSSIATGYGVGRPLYVPTSTQIREGGYEVEGFQSAFGLCGHFAEDVDDRVSRSFKTILQKMRKPFDV
ncbi:MAG: hypothetical protein ACTHNN_10430 [Xanthobacteraceae bacterium]